MEKIKEFFKEYVELTRLKTQVKDLESEISSLILERDNFSKKHQKATPLKGLDKALFKQLIVQVLKEHSSWLSYYPEYDIIESEEANVIAILKFKEPLYSGLSWQTKNELNLVEKNETLLGEWISEMFLGRQKSIVSFKTTQDKKYSEIKIEFNSKQFD